VSRAPVAAGADTDRALAEWGFDEGEVSALKVSGAIA
jgi:crotonobetainyl-CoA:carnitine CoA-transferase CaiB-like acyl-CoA transferase